jgi:hypothetical protein
MALKFEIYNYSDSVVVVVNSKVVGLAPERLIFVTWSQLCVHPLESSLEAVVAKVEVDPLGRGEAHDGVELRLRQLQQVVALQDVVIAKEAGFPAKQVHRPT